MTRLEDDLRAMFHAHEQDIDAATTPDYVTSVRGAQARVILPLLSAATAVVVSVAAFLAWPTIGPGADRPAGLPISAADSPPQTGGPDVIKGARGGDPAGLIGSWVVTGTPETEPITLAFSESELTISRPCGSQGGEWRASPTGLFVANTTFWSMPCQGGGTPPLWLTAASAFELDGDRVRLLDLDGAPVAILVAGDAPGSTAGQHATTSPIAPRGEAEPQSTARDVVPDTLEPATPDRLLGRWTSADEPEEDEAPTQPFARFSPDGTWNGSDGCNGQGGRWAANDQGELLGTQGPQTLIGCDGMTPIGGWVASAAAAGFDEDILVLLDASGQEVARLLRS